MLLTKGLRITIRIFACLTFILLALALFWPKPRMVASSIVTSTYNLIQDEGSPLTRRTTLDFTGTGVSCADSGGITQCTITGSGTPSYACHTYALSNNGTNWTVAVDGGGAVAGAAIAASATQSVTLFALGARLKVVGLASKTTTAWSGTGFTSFDSTVGDSVGGTTFYTSIAYDLDAAVTNTNFQDATMWKSATYAGSNVQAVITANQNLTTNPITGVAEYQICTATLP